MKNMGEKKTEEIMMREEAKEEAAYRVGEGVFDIADQMEEYVLYVEDMKKALYLMEQGLFALRGDNQEVEMSCVRIIQRQLVWLCDEMRQCRGRLLELSHVPEDS